ncbi:MAG: hypothetical protein U1A27_03480 [Phycisphaerae bacterium]
MGRGFVFNNLNASHTCGVRQQLQRLTSARRASFVGRQPVRAVGSTR